MRSKRYWRAGRAGAGLALAMALTAGCSSMRGTGDMGVIIERAAGRVQVVEHTGQTRLFEVKGLGDLSHAAVVYSRDERYAYVFGRDGGLTKVDILAGKIAKRVVQAGNSIGGAISEDGRLIAVANYEPGGVQVFSADTLELLADIPATYGEHGARSKVVGLEDAPGQRFVFSLWDSGEIWLADLADPRNPVIRKFQGGKQPYDALVSPDGRYYIAGLYGEDGLAVLDLWNVDAGVKRVLKDYGRGQEKLPVFKMPHLEGWAVAGNYALVPGIGHHSVLVVDTNTWEQVAQIPTHGQPVFVMARPDQRQVWVNFAHPLNDTVQIIDVKTLSVVQTLQPGKAVLHMEFSPRGEQVWISLRDSNRVDVYDTHTFKLIKSLPADSPSGIFFTARAHRIGL